MADTPNQGPAPGIVIDATGANTAGNDATAGASPAQPDLQKKLDATLQENQKLTERYKNLERLLGAHTQELGQLRQLREQVQTQETTPAYSEGYAAQTQPTPTPDQQTIVDRQNVGVLMYRTETPDWRDHEGSIKDLLQDPVEYAAIAYVNPDGSIDAYKTYRAAHREVVNRRLLEAQGKAQETQETSDEQRNILATQAHISGSTVGQEQQVITLDQLKTMSREELAKLGAQVGAVDPNDLPSMLRKP